MATHARFVATTTGAIPALAAASLVATGKRVADGVDASPVPLPPALEYVECLQSLDDAYDAHAHAYASVLLVASYPNFVPSFCSSYGIRATTTRTTRDDYALHILSGSLLDWRYAVATALKMPVTHGEPFTVIYRLFIQHNYNLWSDYVATDETDNVVRLTHKTRRNKNTGRVSG